jgi:tRNA modification GTPase
LLAAPDPNDTIVALASPRGPSARGLIRLSGPRAWPVATAGFEPDDDAPPPRRAEMVSGRLRVAGLRPRLPAIVALWPGPRTYTGQDVAELHVVGSSPLLDLLLADRLGHGARHAQPGEFTMRAFLCGRIDLTRAEAVLGVIDAATPAQLDGALRQLAGGLSGPILALRDRLLDVTAHLEAGLDFVDEADVDPIADAALAAELQEGASELAGLASRLSRRDRSGQAPRVILLGPPNAGKSRLFNALLGREHAIVSPLAGTTRDYLTAPCECHGITVELIDTAGIEHPRNAIEAQAQSLRDALATQADVVLLCASGDSASESHMAGFDQVVTLRVRTKSDLVAAREEADDGWLWTSAESGAGLDELRRAIGTTLLGREGEVDLPASTGARCRDSLLRAGEALEGASLTLLAGGGGELVSIDLRLAIDELGKVVGAVVTDDILDRIFRKFCIGK